MNLSKYLRERITVLLAGERVYTLRACAAIAGAQDVSTHNHVLGSVEGFAGTCSINK